MSPAINLQEPRSTAAVETPPCVIPGTYLFDGTLALKGYALNKMCYSFN